MKVSLSDLINQQTVVDPRYLLVVSQPKVGKTSALMQLPNSLVIDLEDSTGFFSSNMGQCTALNLKSYAIKHKCSLLEVYRSIVPQIEDQKYDFIIIDTISALEGLAIELATINYKNSIIGKNFKGSDVTTELPNGAGYSWYNQAFEELIDSVRYLCKKCCILSAHLKFVSVNKVKDSGKSMDNQFEFEKVNVVDLDLKGKLKKIIASQVDAIGIMFRSRLKPNTVGISFKPLEGSHLNESRSQHLRGKRFILSELDESTNTLKTYWHNIFSSLATSNSSRVEELNEDIFIPLSEE